MRSSIYFLLIFAVSFFENLTAQDQPQLKIISPRAKEVIELSGTGVTILGTLTPSDTKLNVNGNDAIVDIDGTFICHTPIELSSEKSDSGFTTGKFIFNLSNGNRTSKIEKTYSVKLPVRTSSTDSIAIDKAWETEPIDFTTVELGEAVKVEFKATPGCRGYVKVEGTSDSVALNEGYFVNSFYWGEAVFGSGLSSKGDTIRGIYRASIILNQPLKNAWLTATLTHPKLGTFTYRLPGRISTLNGLSHRIAKIKYDPNLVVGRTSPGGGYKVFLPEGVELEIIGQSSGWLKTRLSKDESVYISSSSVEMLPFGTPVPQSSTRIIRTKDNGKTVSVELAFDKKLPFLVNQTDDPTKIELLVYNAVSDIDWVFYDKKSDLIKEIRHSQPKDGVLKLEIQLNQKTHWGYSTSYEGNVLKLSINKPSKRNSRFLFWSNQLKGRVISIDPGHTSDYGAVGPRGTKEKDVNFEISLKLKQMLESSGATVYLTHERDKDLQLRDRKAVVNSFNPEISVSMHNNAVPGGVNPIEHNGSSVYYYYPQALPLAKMVHENLLNNLKLKDFGLYWDNLYMCRIPEAVSILVEPAFMIVPEQERLLKTEDFQKKIARSVFDAINSFYEEYAQ
ncbi:MAG: N-acetylmuramoyl-L-alanine amidase [Bacillota bacterium]